MNSLLLWCAHPEIEALLTPRYLLGPNAIRRPQYMTINGSSRLALNETSASTRSVNQTRNNCLNLNRASHPDSGRIEHMNAVRFSSGLLGGSRLVVSAMDIDTDANVKLLLSPRKSRGITYWIDKWVDTPSGWETR